jgi:hypothetical protein
MNELDKKLYEMFAINFDEKLWSEEYTKNHPPQLHDVFRVAKGK